MAKKSFMMGAFLGTLAGGLAALLFAPKAGKEMRKDLKKKTKELGDKAEDFYCNVTDKVTDIVDKAKDIAEETRDAVSKFLKEQRKK